MSDPVQLLGEAAKVLIVMVLSLTVHEFAHAFAAKRLGDNTAEGMGRLTLNPIAHIDPIGTIFLPLVLLLTGGVFFGWAKPVPVNPTRFDRKMSMRTGMTLVAGAGPFANFVMAFLSQGVWVVFARSGILMEYPVLNELLLMMVQINVVLCIFNLIPVHPLDGQKVLAGLLPAETAISYERFTQRYGMFILLGIIMFAGHIMATPVALMLHGIRSVFGLA